MGSEDSAFKVVEKFLQDDGWNPEYISDKKVFKISFSSEHGEGSAYAQVLTELYQFVFYVMVPFKSPEENLPGVSELINRINFGLRVGNFEMDFEDGEIRFKSCIDFEGESLTPGYVKNLIYPSLKTTERYIPAFLSVIWGGQKPEDACAAIDDQV